MCHLGVHRLEFDAVDTREIAGRTFELARYPQPQVLRACREVQVTQSGFTQRHAIVVAVEADHMIAQFRLHDSEVRSHREKQLHLIQTCCRKVGVQVQLSAGLACAPEQLGISAPAATETGHLLAHDLTARALSCAEKGLALDDDGRAIGGCECRYRNEAHAQEQQRNLPSQ